jgi:citrate synthase
VNRHRHALYIDPINILINVDSTMQSPALPRVPSAGSPSLSAAEAARLLGVKPQTVYAYASRGLLRRLGQGKRRRYLLEDVERLQLRQRARSGHGPVAAAALSFGEPVLDTHITGIDQRGPRYRGTPAIELAEQGHTFEAVAELLWSGRLPHEAPTWQALDTPTGRARRSIEELAAALPVWLAAATATHVRAPAAELLLARGLIRSLALLLVAPGKRRRRGRIAELLSESCAGAARRVATQALDQALVLLADHELNASSFAARIAASTDASLPACLVAALATLSGPRHGGACDRVEALLEEASQLARPVDIAEQRARRGDVVPGFGHPLYPQGDPRAQRLLELSQKLASQNRRAQRRVETALVLARTMQRQGLPATVDFGLVALTRALGMPAGSAALLFALGRSAGWVAHVLEQRTKGAVLRPRARYVGT